MPPLFKAAKGILDLWPEIDVYMSLNFLEITCNGIEEEERIWKSKQGCLSQ